VAVFEVLKDAPFTPQRRDQYTNLTAGVYTLNVKICAKDTVTKCPPCQAQHAQRTGCR
jgi:hypothetical protein